MKSSTWMVLGKRKKGGTRQGQAEKENQSERAAVTAERPGPSAWSAVSSRRRVRCHFPFPLLAEEGRGEEKRERKRGEGKKKDKRKWAATHLWCEA